MSGVVMVTGGTGFLGRWTVKGLLERGFTVHVLGAPTEAALPLEAQGGIMHSVNLLDDFAVRRLMEDVAPTHLVHFAWNAVPGIYWNSSDNFDWVAASLHLIHAFRRVGGCRFVGAGSCAEYNWASAAVCHETMSPLVLEAAASSTPYAVCKAALGKIVATYAATDGFSAAWGRIFFQYGPYEYPQRLVPSIINALLEGHPADCSHGHQRRNFLSAMDVGDAFAALAASRVEGPVNIADPNEITIGELARMIGLAMGRPDLIRLGRRASPPNEPQVLLARTDRLINEVGWVPRESLETGLKKTIDWWTNHRLAAT